jgi:hypothetical protein
MSHAPKVSFDLSLMSEHLLTSREQQKNKYTAALVV